MVDFILNINNAALIVLATRRHTVDWMEQYIHCAIDVFILISRNTLRQDFTEFQSPAMAIRQVYF
jgi:hypothetical protein